MIRGDLAAVNVNETTEGGRSTELFGATHDRMAYNRLRGV